MVTLLNCVWLIKGITFTLLSSAFVAVVAVVGLNRPLMSWPMLLDGTSYFFGRFYWPLILAQVLNFLGSNWPIIECARSSYQLNNVKLETDTRSSIESAD